MLLALPTCASLPGWEVDDRPLHEALRARGAVIERPVWDDPTVDWSRFDACLIRTTWDYQEKLDAFLAWAARVDSVTRLFNPLEVVRWSTHKSYLRELEGRGVPVVPTRWSTPDAPLDVAATLAETGWSRAFLKPAVGATARETLRFEDDDAGRSAASAHLDRLHAAGETLLLQPYLDRVERDGERSAIVIDGRITHAVLKVPVPGDYRVQDDFGAHDEPMPADAALVAATERALDAAGFGPLLYARADFLLDAAGDLRLTELELVEPSLFFRHAPPAADTLASALLDRVRI